jgi:hypothetical protein
MQLWLEHLRACRLGCPPRLGVADDGSEIDRNPVDRGSDIGECLGLVSGAWRTHMSMVDVFDRWWFICVCKAGVGRGRRHRCVIVVM